MNTVSNVVIAGAGVTGLAFAARLAQAAPVGSVSITVVEAAPRPIFDADSDVALRVSAIANGSIDLLDDIGAWSVVEQARVCPYDHMRVWDEADDPGGPATLRFDADEFGVPRLGCIVENQLLQHAMLEVLDSLDVELRFESSIASIEETKENRKLVFESGEAISADLVVAADGARSLVRESVGIEVTRLEYDQVAVVTHLVPERPHANTAWQRFLRDGPIGMLPLSDGRISVVWSTTPDAAESALAFDDEALGKLLTDISDGVLGKLEVAGPRGKFPLAAQHAMDYVRRGVALIGDAAHTVHPLAGQGANLGIQDARELADVVSAAIHNGEHPADRPVLRRYERSRKGSNATMMHFMTGLNRLFASDSEVLGELRRAGMQLFNRAGPIRERVVGVALGANRR